MPVGTMTMAKGGVHVALTAEETERLKAIQAERDAAYRVCDDQWEALFDAACLRAGLVRVVDVQKETAT